MGVGATAEAEEAGAAAAEATTVPSAPTTVKAERPARAPAEATGAAAAAGDYGFDFDSTSNQLCCAYFSSSLESSMSEVRRWIVVRLTYLPVEIATGVVVTAAAYLVVPRARACFS